MNDKRSVQLGLLQDGSLVNVGNCTVPANQNIPLKGAFVEVRYLYAHEGGCLFQPTLLGIRTDKSIADEKATLRKAPPEKRVAA